MSSGPVGRIRELKSQGGAFPLKDRSRFLVSGPDHIRYLNGQLSIDVRRLEPGGARPALLLTAKGKLCADLQVWRVDEGIVLEASSSLREETADRLERYLVADEVDVTVLPEDASRFHIFGKEPSPGSLRVNRIGIPGYDAGQLPEGTLLAEDSEVELLRISHGVPRWGTELGPDTLPQEARLDLTSVDFDKGCYVGQEVVSRLKSVGRVRLLLHRFQGDLYPAARPVSLFRKDAPEAPAGVITSAAYDFGLAQMLALGYVNREFDDIQTFLAADASGVLVGELEKRPI